MLLKFSQSIKLFWTGECSLLQGFSIASSLATVSLGLTESFLTHRQIGMKEKWYHTLEFGKKKVYLIGTYFMDKKNIFTCNFCNFYRLPLSLLPHPDNLPSLEPGVHSQSAGSFVHSPVYGSSLPSYGGMRAEGCNRLQRTAGQLPQEGVQWSLHPGSWVHCDYYRF